MVKPIVKSDIGSFNPTAKMLHLDEKGLDFDLTMVIVFTLLACFSNALSLILMKLSIEKVSQKHRKLKAENEGLDVSTRSDIEKESSVLNKWWIAGFVFIIVGTVSNIFAIRYGNLVLLASTSALTLIFSTVLSVKILGEEIYKSDFIGIFLICIGCICSMLCAQR